jgi:hypothetical protein
MKLWQLATLSLLLPLSGQTPIQELTQAEKNALLSRKKWYVTYSFSLSGSGGEGGTNWRVSSQTGGTIELNHVTPGQFPLSSLPADVQDRTPGRFIGWMAMPTDETYRRMEAGETNPARLEGQYYPFRQQVGATRTRPHGNETREDTWSGAGTGYAVGPCQLLFDLKKGTYDLMFTVGSSGQGLSTIRHTWRSPDNSGEDDAVAAHWLAWLPGEWMPQLAARKLRQDMKPDGTISFSFQGPVAKDPRPIGMGPLNFSGTFTISPTPPSTAVLYIEPEELDDYREWRPIPGLSEDEAGSDVGLLWEVEEPGVPQGQEARVVKVTFRLAKVSKYPGVCMNWPLPPSGASAPPPKHDLRFGPHESSVRDGYSVSSDGQVAICSGASVEHNSGGVFVECFDGGAIGEVVAEAELSDGRILQAQVRGQPASGKILIPDRDEGVSDIAKQWRAQRAGALSDDSDDENIPVGDPAAPGDGLSVWEEYRGFYQGGEWKNNCFPKRKDLFIINKVGARAKDGIELFERATGLVVHDELLDTECIPHNVINFNKRADRHIVDQNGLYMKEVPGDVGYAKKMPGRNFPGPPKNTMSVRVAMIDSIDVVFQLTPNFRVTQNANSTHIAHELSHGIGVYHHGDRDTFGGTDWHRASGVTIPGISSPVDRVIEGAQTGPLIDVLLEAGLTPMGNDAIFGVGGTQIKIWIGERSGQHSGDVNCVMRYAVAQAYRREGAPSTRVIHATLEPYGDALCTSQIGTLFNYITHSPQSRYGPADTKRGNCAQQFVISDKFDKQDRQ